MRRGVCLFAMKGVFSVECCDGSLSDQTTVSEGSSPIVTSLPKIRGIILCVVPDMRCDMCPVPCQKPR